MSEALHGKVTIAKTNMSWTGGLKVVGLNIDSAMLSDMKIWLNVNEVELVPSYITLLSNSVVISSFTLKEPHIEVEFIKDKKQLPHQSNLSTKQQSKVKKDGSIEPSKGFSVKATSITDGNIRFRDHSYPDFTHINLNGNIEIQSNEIDSGISSFSMNIQNGSVKGSGFYIAEMGNVRANMDIEVSNLESISDFKDGLRYLLPLFQTGLGDIKCTTDLRIKLAGNGPDLRDMLDNAIGGGELKITNGQFTNSPVMSALSTFLNEPSLTSLKFDTISERFTIKDGKVYNTLTEAIGKSANLTLSGWVDFDLNMDYRIILDDKIVAKADKDMARIINVANKAGGIRLKGKVTSPKIDIDVEKAIKSGIKDILEKELQDELYKKQKKKK